MKRFVRDLKEKDHVQTVFLVAEKNTGTDRNGKPFMSLTLNDSTGSLNARMFEKVGDSAAGFEVGDVVWIKGFVQLFQNRKQLIIHEVRKALDGEFSMPDLIADLGGDPREHFDNLMKMVESLSNAFVRELLQKTLTDPEIQPLMLKAPAAKTIHHAYRGGLIEHIHSIAQVMESLAKHYSFLDRSLLIFGAIFHDLGKVFELDLSDGIRYTQSGRLVGHMVLACEMVDKAANSISGFPQDLRDVLKHIVLSHHGKLEYGSPKLPMIPEAIVVAMIDELDSRMNTLYHFLKIESESVSAEEKWSHYHPGFERYFFLDFFRKGISESEK
jgi:3'-5' exoribonuclease